MKRWKCIVCKYIHEGDAPPDTCPICKVPREKFVEVDAFANPVEESPTEEKPRRKPRAKPAPQGNALSRSLIKYHAHPMSVHIPNGVVPISAVFAFAAVLFNFAGLAEAAFYNNIVVVVSMPFVLFSGYLSWQIKYRGYLSQRFISKIISSSVAALASVGLVVWYYLDPQVLAPNSVARWPFLALNLVLFAAVGLSGFVGGKLVFKE